MVKIISRMRDLNFSQLMEVYAQSNEENAREFFPELDANESLLQAEQDFYAYLRDCFFTTQGACCAVWEEKGRYVSALRLEPYGDGLLLAALETAPEARRKGYAKRLVSQVLQETDVPVYSHVHKQNRASLELHLQCGFERISEQARYVDGTVNDRCCTLRRK